MHRRSVVAFALLAGSLGGPVSRAESQVPPAQAGSPVTGPRDNAATKDTGSARISGRVVAADTGAPLRRAEVSLIGETPDVSRAAVTDERGRYELSDLPNGRFRLDATKAGYISLAYGQTRPSQASRPVELTSGQVLERIDFALPRGGVIAGRVTDEFGDPVADISVQARKPSTASGRQTIDPVGGDTTDDRGAFRIFGLAAGDYYVSAQLLVPYQSRSSSRTVLAPTYYPGTPNQADAQRIRLAAGGEFPAAHFALAALRAVRVTGSVITSAGTAAEQGVVVLAPADRDNPPFAVAGGSAQVEANGAFTLVGIAPGDYVLQVGTGTNLDGEVGSLPLRVDGTEDVTGLVVTTSGPTALSGQVVFNGTPPEKARPSDLLLVVRSDLVAEAFAGGRITVHDDWTFEGHASGGPIVIAAARPPDGWMLESVLLNGEDVTESGLPARGGEHVDGLRIVLTDRITHLTGSASDDLGRPVRDYVALVFPDEPASSTSGRRRVRREAADQQGHFEIEKLRPGRYLAIAVLDLEDGQASDPAFLGSLRASAMPFELREGETKTLTLRLSARQ